MSRRSVSKWFWVYIMLFFVCFAGLFFTTLSMSFRHTYELPVDSPGMLLSDRWSFEFVAQFLMFIYLLNLIAVFYMLVKANRVGVNVNIFACVVLLIFFAVFLSFDIVSIVNANAGPSEEGFTLANQARDPRWCCVYGGTSVTSLMCSVNVTKLSCGPITPAQLVPNHIFITKLCFHIFIGVLLAWCLIYTWATYSPTLKVRVKKK